MVLGSGAHHRLEAEVVGRNWVRWSAAQLTNELALPRTIDLIQRVVIEDSVSVDQELKFGVPQGSVLGPRIYCMLVISSIGMNCLTIPMKMTRSCI